MPWTIEQILALAPDSASAKAGQSLASSHKWLSLGCNDAAVWGECQGSGIHPYRTGIDPHAPAYRCTCPSRKIPCKHVIGLFLLFGAQPQLLTVKSPPDWLTDWLASRAERAQVRAEKATGNRKPSRSSADPHAQSKRAVEREARVAAGLAELDLWMRDLVRNGLAVAQTQPLEFWERPAARLVDAQAPGIARLVRQLPGIPSSRDGGTGRSGWHARLLERLSRIHLLIEGFKRIAELPAETQADLRSAIGWTQNQEELLSARGSRDEWSILGRRVFEEDRLKVRRTWLCGRASRRFAILLEFAAGNQPFEIGLTPGAVIDAELVFYPGAVPLRALVKERFVEAMSFSELHGVTQIDEHLAASAAAMAANPWIETFPAAFRSVIPLHLNEQWYLRDADSKVIPIAKTFGHGWSLLALSGGREIDLFGEWDGEYLWPLSVLAEGRFIQYL